MESCNFLVNSYFISSSAFGKNIKHSFVIFFKLFLLIIKYIKSKALFCNEISLSFKNSKIIARCFCTLAKSFRATSFKVFNAIYFKL